MTQRGEARNRHGETPTKEANGRRSLTRRALLAGAAAVGTASMPWPLPAFAADHAPRAPQHISGTCTVRCTNPEPLWDGTVGNLFDVTMPDGKTYGARCIDGELYATPADGTYRFEGTLQDDGSFEIIVRSDGADTYPGRTPSSLGTQRIGGFRYRPYGRIELWKSSSDEETTTGNACYSLAGTTYSLHEADGTFVQHLVTDENGHALSGDVPRGDYYLTETTPGAGFALDTATYDVTLDADIAAVRASDAPLSATVEAWARKIDAETGDGAPQGAASLAHAHFEFRHYGGVYETEEQLEGVEPKSTWTMQTDQEGRIPADAHRKRFAGSDGTQHPYLVAGHPPLVGDTTALPLGTVAVREVRAPEGYLLKDAQGRPPATHLVVLDADAQGNVGAFHAPEQADRVARGDIQGTKFGEQAPDDDDEPSQKTPLSGIGFTFTLEETGEEFGPVFTDDDGFFTTRALAPEGTAGGLPYGTYTVTETHWPDELDGAYRIADPIVGVKVGDGTLRTLIIENRLVASPVRVVKKDAASGSAIAAAGLVVRLLDADGNVIEFSQKAPHFEAVSEFTADETGTVVFPERLAAGDYFVEEVSAPAPYLLADGPVPFTVDEHHDWDDPALIEVVLVDRQATGTLRGFKFDTTDDAPVSGAHYEISAVGDIVTPDGTQHYADGDAVAHVTTDDQGVWEVTGLPLGDGAATYRVTEIATAPGYLLERASKDVTLTYVDQETDVVFATAALPQHPTEVRILKVDARDGTPLAGVEFACWDASLEKERPAEGKGDGDATDADGGETALPGGSNSAADDADGGAGQEESDLSAEGGDQAATPPEGALRAVTNEKGVAVFRKLATHPEQGFATYRFRETAAPEGYICTAGTQSLTLDATGRWHPDEQSALDEAPGTDIGVLSFPNERTRVAIVKADAADDRLLEGGRFVLLDADGSPVRPVGATEEESCEFAARGNEPVLFERLIVGAAYTLREIEPPPGYELGNDVVFVVQPRGETQLVAMRDTALALPKQALGKTSDAAPFAFAASTALVAATYGLCLYSRRRAAIEAEAPR